MFFRVTLYCAIGVLTLSGEALVRSGGGGVRWWNDVEQVMITALDGMLTMDVSLWIVPGSIPERWPLYAGLASTALLVVATTIAHRQSDGGFGINSMRR